MVGWIIVATSLPVQYTVFAACAACLFEDGLPGLLLPVAGCAAFVCRALPACIAKNDDTFRRHGKLGGKTTGCDTLNLLVGNSICYKNGLQNRTLNLALA